MAKRIMEYCARCLGVFIATLAAFVCVAAASPDRLPGHRQIPPGYQLPPPKLLEHHLTRATLRIYARAFAQGEVVYVEIIPDSASEFPSAIPECRFGGLAVRLVRREWGYRGFFPVHADSTAGKKTLLVSYTLADSSVTHRITIPITATPFQVSHSAMDVGKYSDIDHAKDPAVQKFIAECSAKKEQAFARLGEDLITSSLAHPRNIHAITSSFWNSRVYDRYEMKNGQKVTLSPSRKVHRGIDMRGARGAPVYAIADGEVLLAETLYYEGNFVLLDHGNGIMSFYMHQDSLLVTKGERVRAGQHIGTVGATGVSTGPHLHVSLMIDRIHVDPLSILPLPVRD